MDTSESSLFETYHQEFSSLVRQLYEETSPETTSNKAFQQCQDLLEQMKVEARSEPDSDKRHEQMVCIKACNSQLQALALESNKQELMSSRVKQRTNKTHEMLERQNETLERARQSIQETEEVGLAIAEELQSNRTTIESTQNKVQEVSTMTDRAGQILKNMSKPWWRP